MNKILHIFRTHIINQAVISELKKLRESLNDNEDYVLFIDNSKNLIKEEHDSPICTIKLENQDINAFLFTQEIYDLMNFPYYAHVRDNSEYDKTLWYNGDYTFYVVRKYFPDYDYYWMTEYDVFCNGPSYRTFLDKYVDSNADLIVSELRKEEHNTTKWCWSYYTNWIYGDKQLYGCFFPVVRLSAKATDFLYNRRMEHKDIFKDRKPIFNERWIYTECFVPTEIMNNGFSSEILNEKLRYEPNYNLNIERIFENPDNLLYHPVK